MQRPVRRSASAWATLAVSLVLVVPALVIPITAGAQLAPPWDGNPISAGLGPTYGESWCAEAAPGSSIATQQGPPLALIPVEAIRCTLDGFLSEASAAGIPNRMSYSVIGQSTTGWDMYEVVVNALETPEQQRDYERWLELRSIMLTDPAAGQALIEEWGGEVKLPIFIEANIHGGEEEGTDAIMQVIRDLTTTPYGVNAAVDSLLDHAILIVIPSQNPDGRFAGTRANGNGFDMNRDLLVQSQVEIRHNVAAQLRWLAPVGLAMHCCANPTLIDGLTKPHNPGLEYDLFVNWNQRRLDANEAAHNAIGREIDRPVNDWNADAETVPPVGPAYAEGWDDWGPFYTQTYMAFYGVDSSTVEMCSTSCDGRIGSKTAQYLTFYSSATFWIDNRNPILHDQLEIFRRGVTSAPRPNCCDDPLIASRGFTEEFHNWMVPYPRAFVIPFDGTGQRSDAEANRMTQWLLDNGIQVEFIKQSYNWKAGRTTFPKGSYVVWLDQPLRGLALTTLDEGQDISDRISQLYAPPGAWSHGQLWGADVVEIPAGSSTFNPTTQPLSEPHALTGGVGGFKGKPTWYSLTLRGVSEVRAVLDLLRSGIDAEIAESSLGATPAGSFIFPADNATAAALSAAGGAAGVVFVPHQGAKPPTTQVDEAPRIAVLVNSAAPAMSDTMWSLQQIFGSDAAFVSTVLGTNSLQNAATDPLLDFDVIYNAGQNYPAATSATAQARLQAFFARGGGYIGTSQSGNNFAFLTGAGLVTTPLTQTSDSAGGGIARWDNTGLAAPLTSGFTAQDFLYLPSNVTYFSATPAGSVVDGRYLPDTTSMFVAGLWLDRDPAAAGAPMVLHGDTTVASRYAALATNPFSRGDAEREWLWVGQAALWSNLTDEA